MLNEELLSEALHKKFKLPVQFVRNEDLSFAEQIKVLRRAVIAVGMHGSLLIMGLFLPPGSILIELFPFAVPSENYTPYKTMCELKGMFLTYGTWTVRSLLFILFFIRAP